MIQFLGLPWAAPNLNDLLDAKSRGSKGHRGKRWNPYNDAKREWCVRVYAACVIHRITPMRSASIRFDLSEANRKRDPDNVCAGATKFILDGLVSAGILPGDGWSHVLGLEYAWGVGVPGMLVTLTGESLSEVDQ